MKTLVKIALTVWLGGIYTAATAQSDGRISGSVTDTAGKPLDRVTLSLLYVPDSALIRTSVSDNDGNFIFSGLRDGNYLLRLSGLGFSTYYNKPLLLDATHRQLNIGNVSIKRSADVLPDVPVQGRRQFVQQKTDRTIVNVDALIGNSGTTALDVLEKSPGVSVDQDGNISLRGKPGVIVYIDDKPTYLSGGDLAGYLRALPAATLNQVEIMNNPPARFDAAGSSVINLRTRRSAVHGMNGSLSLSYARGRYGKANHSFTVNQRTNHVALAASGGYTQQNGFNDLDINRLFLNTDGSTYMQLLQNSYIRRTGDAYTLKLGADYYATDRTTFGLAVTGLYRPSTVNNRVTNDLLNASNMIDSVLSATNIENNTLRNGGVTANYRHLLDKAGTQLTADLDYIVYGSRLNQDFLNASYYPGFRTSSTNDELSGNLPSDIRIAAAKTDFDHPFGNGWKLGAGMKSSYTKTVNTAAYAATVNGVTTPDYQRSNRFTYRETVSSGYLNLERNFRRLSVQAGMRAENTLSRGYQAANPVHQDSAFRRTYTSVFPTAFLSYKTDSAATHVFSVNFGRRISRPYYQDLNPFTSPLDKFTYYVGNPFLKPAFTQNAQLSWTLKGRLTASLSYSRTTDKVSETIEITNGTYFSRPGNIGRQVIKSFTVDASADPAKWLGVHVYTELMNLRSVSDFYTGRLDNRGTLWTMNTVAQVNFGGGWTGEVQGYYRTAVTDSQFFIYSLLYVNSGVQKRVGKTASLRLNVTDLFCTRVVKGKINNLERTEANWNNQSDSRTLALTLSWRFGKTLSNQQKYEGNGAADEQNRVKN